MKPSLPSICAVICSSALLLLKGADGFVPQQQQQPSLPRHRNAPLYSSSSSASLSSSSSTAASATEARTWSWQGHSIHAEVTPPSSPSSSSSSSSSSSTTSSRPLPPVLLIHGFGCSTTYWRRTTEALTQAGHTVHAIDLLGQGRSAKPSDVYYSINLWAGIVDDYVRERIVEGGEGEGVVLMGNSLGSLVALAAAVGDHHSPSPDSVDDDGTAAAAAEKPFLTEPDRVRGICMFNCGVGLNSRGIVDDPAWSPVGRAVFKFVLWATDTLLFNNPPVLSYVLDEVVTPELLRNALEGLYRYDPSNVDDELVESFYRPAKDEGAKEALRQIYTNDPGLSPMQIHSKHPHRLEKLPIHLVWGDDDAVTPLEGGVGTFYRELAEDPTSNSMVSMDVVEGTGHVPFDDHPERSNGSMLEWLARTI